MPYVEYDEVEAICSGCGRVFRSEEALAEHQSAAHSGQESAARPSPHKLSVKCSLCRQKFLSVAALREHTARAHAT